MITIILTYRNRNLYIVKNCLESLAKQSNPDFEVLLVDYGSVNPYKNDLKDLVSNYTFIKLLRCETEQQLWCKSRAINIALKQCETPFCFVGDIDMIYHPEFITILKEQTNIKQTTYFQVGFLSEEESKLSKTFGAYSVAFKSQKEATGMTLYDTKVLQSINGYDEFYNGWGSEDTDTHLRLQNAGLEVAFYTKRLLMLHQWHPKNYRTKNDVTPFHNNLEQINAAYLELVAVTKKVKANTEFAFGVYNDEDYSALNTVNEEYTITNKVGELSAFINGVLLLKKQTVVKLNITLHIDYKSTKQKTKALLGKKTLAFDTMQTLNNTLLECVISQFRNQPYQFQFDSNASTITLIIKL